MGEIETNRDATLLRCCCDFLDLEQLTSEKVYTADHHNGKLIGVLLDKIDNLFRSDSELAFARPREKERFLRIEPVMDDLRFDRVGVGREGGFFHQNLEARFRR